MSERFTVRKFGDAVARYAQTVEHCDTEQQARKVAAMLLDRKNLRGVPMWWDDFHGRTVYAPKSGHEFVTIRNNGKASA